MVETAISTKTLERLCQALAGRRLCLFLGAGVNATTRNRSGESVPLGAGLSKILAAKLLGYEDYDAPLDKVAAMAEHRVGRPDVDATIRKALATFQPGDVHKIIAALPFDSIYTTNYDTLVESASKDGKVVPIFSAETDIGGLTDDSVPYYKLHGCIDHSGSEEGRLTLTVEDYRVYEKHRRPLFRRLIRDLQSRTFLFIGYSLADTNFRAILEDCRTQLDVDTLPESFVVIPSVHEAEEVFWREKYNLHVVKASADTLLPSLKEQWLGSDWSRLDSQARRQALHFSADEQASFRRVGECFFQVEEAGCTGPADAASFFKGRTASWSDVRDSIPAERDAWATTWELLEEVDSHQAVMVSTWAIVGAAGTGKTTLCKTILWSILRSWQVPVLQQIPGARLDASSLAALVDRDRTRRLFVYIPTVDEQLDGVLSFLHDLRHRKIPATVLLEERSALWAARCEGQLDKWLKKKIELGRLSSRDIDSILDRMAEHGALGRLEQLPRAKQAEHFEALAESELLVALRLLTEDATLDELVRSEYRSIPGDVAKKAYALVSTVGQVDQFLRYEVLRRILKVPIEDMQQAIFTPTHGVLLDAEMRGASRHNRGYRLRARHPLIASIVFDAAAPDDDAKFALIHQLLTSLDSGFIEDRQLLHRLVVGHKLVETMAAPHRKRALYDLLEQICPQPAFVFQHRSMLERELRDAAAALEFAKKAARLEPHNLSIKNTLGFAFEAAARAEKNSEKFEHFIEQARRLFDEGIRADPENAYGYAGMANIMRHLISAAREADRAAARVALIEFLEDAMEATRGSSLIASLLADEMEKLGDADVAVGHLKDALTKKPNDSRARDHLSRLLIEAGALAEAAEIVAAGLKLDATSWRLHRNQARLLELQGAKPEVIKVTYETSVRYRQGDAELLIEYGAFLFRTGEHKRAASKFAEAHAAELQKRRAGRPHVWRDGSRQRRVFQGQVQTISGNLAWVVAAPEGFKARFWRSDPRAQTLRQGDRIEFTIQFNSMGPEAVIRHPRPPR